MREAGCGDKTPYLHSASCRISRPAAYTVILHFDMCAGTTPWQSLRPANTNTPPVTVLGTRFTGNSLVTYLVV
jgi:hypothetical protein